MHIIIESTCCIPEINITLIFESSVDVYDSLIHYSALPVCWCYHRSHSLFLLRCFLFLAFYFDFFHRISISLLTLSICYCTLYTFSIHALTILIIIIFSSLFMNVNLIWVLLWCLLCIFRLYLGFFLAGS